MLKLEMQEGMKRPSFVWCNSEGGKGSRVSCFAAADALVRLGGIGDPGSVKVSRDTLGVALEPVLSGLLVEAYMLGRHKSEAAEIDKAEASAAPQEKLTEHQIEWVMNASSRLASLAHFLNKLGIPLPKELAHINVTLQGMHKSRTSDGRPYVEPGPPIPEGYRNAKPDEWQRTDVKIWIPSEKEWAPRVWQGSLFDPSVDINCYIVPIDPPLTDQDACVWPRRWVMVRNKNYHIWEGPFQYVGKTVVADDDVRYSVWDKSGYHRWYTQTRPPTPEELAEHGLTQPPRIDVDAIELGVAFDSLAKDQSEWSQATFGTDSERGPMGALKHLEKEARECQIAETSNDLREELADCLLLLFDGSRRAGLTPRDLVRAAQAKMTKNRSRKWPKAVDGQPCEHVRDEVSE